MHITVALFALLTVFIAIDEWLGCDQEPRADSRNETL